MLRAEGEDAVLVVSGDAEIDSSREIRAFRDGTAPWLVAVRQVSEGVDIPRLEVLVYASDYTTPLFFQQAIGRVLRRRGEGDKARSVVYLPAVASLRQYAQELEELLSYALRDRDEPLPYEDAADAATPDIPDVVYLDSTDARYVGSIIQEGVIDPALVDAWRQSLPPELKDQAAVIAAAQPDLGPAPSGNGNFSAYDPDEADTEAQEPAPVGVAGSHHRPCDRPVRQRQPVRTCQCRDCQEVRAA